MSGFGCSLQEHRMGAKWVCSVCGLVIQGKRNTIHLAVIAHVRAEHRKGLRRPNDGTYE